MRNICRVIGLGATGRVGPFYTCRLPPRVRACVSLCLPIHYGYNNKERPLRQLLSMPPTPLSSVGTCNSPLCAFPPSITPPPLHPRAHMYIILCAMLTLIPLEQPSIGCLHSRRESCRWEKCFRRGERTSREYTYIWCVKMLLAYSIYRVKISIAGANSI